MSVVFFGMATTYHYFQDYVESILRVSREMGLSCSVEMWSSEKIVKPGRIHIFLQSVPEPVLAACRSAAALKRWVVLLNTEQLSRPEWRLVVHRTHDLGFVVLDYSPENIRLMGNLANHYHVPYQDDGSFPRPKTMGACMVGARTSVRRAQIFSELVHTTDVVGFGKARDDLLFQHKILVNVHYNDEYQIHEHMRTDRCVYQGMIVVTEPSVGTEALRLRPYMIVEERAKIPARVHQILRDYDRVRRELFGSFDRAAHRQRTREAWRAIHEKLQAPGS